MYNVGDKIVYPQYGAGVIEAVECKEVDGGIARYYVLSVPVCSLKITISVAKSVNLNLRPIHSKTEVMDIINSAGPIAMSKNWAQRNKDNTEILKSGDLFNIVGVYKTLILRERIHALSSMEKKLLGNARHIILSEIILSQEVDKAKAEEMLVSSMLATA